MTDRKKDIIIHGGENISSKEVEDLPLTHPAIAQAAGVVTELPRTAGGKVQKQVLREALR